MKRFHHIGPAAAAAAVVLALTAGLTGCKNPTDEEVRSSMEVLNVETKWVMKEYRQWPNPKLTLVPTVSFQVKNLTSLPLDYVNFNGLFKEKDAVENLGDNFLAAIRKEGVPPGGVSQVITLKSNFGVEGKSLDSFKNNPQWRTYYVKIFAVTKGSRHVLMGEWPVSRKIDFVEDKIAPPAAKPGEPAGEVKKEEPVKK